MDKKKNILLIDDDDDVREFLTIFLENKGFDIIEAENGRKAKAIIDEKKPDLVISDLLLPGEHGLEVIKYIKDKYFLPVIAISGIYDELELAKDIEEMYIDGFLKKPIDAVVLTDMINKIFNT
jgi:two-component system OmpR family response regulator